MHVEVHGEGIPAVFVHGSFGWGSDTFPGQREVADGYRSILVDRRGFGASPRADVVGWPIDAEDLASLSDDLGSAHLVGQSYGAVVCLLAAGLHLDRVRSLVRAGRVFRAVCERIAERIGATVVVFAGSSHNPQLQEPDRFNALLREVWSAAGSRSSALPPSAPPGR